MPSSRQSSQKKSESQSRSRRRDEKGIRERYNRNNQRIQKAAKLFITNIDSKNLQEQIRTDLSKQFERFGEIKEIIVKTKPGSDNSFAFIQFKTIDDAEKALQSMKGKQFKGKQLKVEFGKGGRKQKERNHQSCYNCHRSGHFANNCTAKNIDRRPGDRYRRRSRSRSSSRDHYNRRYGRYERRSRSRSGDRYRRGSSRYDLDRLRKRYSNSRSDSRRNERRRSRSRSDDHQRNH